ARRIADESAPTVIRQGGQPWRNRFGTLQQTVGADFLRNAPRGRRSISQALKISSQASQGPHITS
ncbi:hypothetical protein, partial [Pseudomonas sp.]|uniref:hypothetical protein n=1 Tax=Pseudomonas sp. TaxID=306 RepID=UPI002899DEAB